MSGPKLSQAELERIRAEQLERERKAALKKLQEAQGAYREACAKVDILKRKADWLSDQVDVVYRSDTKVRIKAVTDKISIISVADTKDPESYHAAKMEQEKIIQKASDEIGEILREVSNRTRNDQKLNDANAVYQSFQLDVNVVGKEISTIKIDFENSYDREHVKRQLDTMLIHFDLLTNRADVPDLCMFSRMAVSAIKRLMAGIDGMQDMDETRSAMQQIINGEQDIFRICAERRELYDEYYALASMTDKSPRNPGDFENAAALRAEISRLRDLYRKQNEMDYIADQINDAMVDLGYTFVTSRILTKRDLGETDFSLYKADEKTGIAVYTDQTGAVMMRMTVLGDDLTITEEDRDFSYQRQIDFCAGHPDLVAALAQRGVFLKQKNYQEPDRAHTYKIDMRGQKIAADKGAVNTDTGVQKTDRRKRRRASSKKVHAM